MSGPRSHARPGRAAPTRLTLALALLASAGSLLPVVAGAGWLVEVVVVLALLTLVSTVLGQLRSPAPVIALAQVVVAALVLTVVHAPAQALAGLVPGPAAVAQGVDLIGDAQRVIRDQSAPIDATSGVRLALTGSAALLLVVMDVLVLALRRPALAGLPMIAVYGVGAVFAPSGLGAFAFLAAGAGYVAVLLVARRTGSRWGPVLTPRAAPQRWRPGPAAVAVALAVVAALAVPALAPLPSSGVTLGGGGGGGSTSVNPLLDLRDALTDRSDTTVISYRTDQDDPQPLRLVTVDSFNGDVWSPSDAVASEPLPRSGRVALPPGLSDTAATVSHRQRITLETLRQEYLPLPYPVSSVDVDGGWRIDPTTGTVTGAGRNRTQPGQTYTVDYLQVSPDAATLAAAPPASSEVVERYTALPPDLPTVIAETAARLTQGDDTAFAKAATLQRWFRNDGGFQYTTEPPAPTSASALADFLTDRQGYCVHFASEMAVMARTLGIPARVAIGFLPGTAAGDGWDVRATDAHAWPELYFSGVGWTRFEPTPSVQTGAAPSWTVPDAPTDGADPDDQAQTAPEPAPAPSVPAPSSTGEDTSAAGTGSQGGAASRAVAVAAAAVGGLALLALLVALPALARGARSSRRWSRARQVGGDAPAEAAWADLVERSGDLGVALSASDTPRRAGERVLAAVTRGDDAGLSPTDERRERVGTHVRRLVSALETSRYGAGGRPVRPGAAGGSTPSGAGAIGVLDAPEVHAATGPAAPVEDLRAEALAVVAALRADVSVRRRVVTSLWPRSGRAALSGVARARRRSAKTP